MIAVVVVAVAVAGSLCQHPHSHLQAMTHFTAVHLHTEQNEKFSPEAFLVSPISHVVMYYREKVRELQKCKKMQKDNNYYTKQPKQQKSKR